MSLVTFPSQEALEEKAAEVPTFMRPSGVPYAAILESHLTGDECDEIIETLMAVDTYTFKGCGAVTREIEAAPCLDPIEKAARALNDWYWQYDLDEGQHSWMQTYEAGNKYQRHMDGSPGQTRKLTAVALLTNPMDYRGGGLTLYVDPKQQMVPTARGTIVVFDHWIQHEVRPVVAGRRQTINMGFWGPPFR